MQYVLLGIALASAGDPLVDRLPAHRRTFFQAVSYPTHRGFLQVFGFVLVWLGSIPAALALLKAPSGETTAPNYLCAAELTRVGDRRGA